MTISRLLNEATTRLKQAQIEDPALEAGLILSWAIKKPRAFIYAHSDMGLNPSDVRRFMELVERRSLGEPFQYITGECEFMSLKFKVNPNVLIPRSDTELLAEAALFSLSCPQPFIDPRPVSGIQTGHKEGSGYRNGFRLPCGFHSPLRTGCIGGRPGHFRGSP